MIFFFQWTYQGINNGRGSERGRKEKMTRSRSVSRPTVASFYRLCCSLKKGHVLGFVVVVVFSISYSLHCIKVHLIGILATLALQSSCSDMD